MDFKQIHKKGPKIIIAIVHGLEVVVAFLIIAIVIIGLAFLIQTTSIGIFDINTPFQDSFQTILSDILLLIVGLELAIMLIKRNPENLIEVMLFVIARKLLIKSDQIWEIAVGVLALAALFAIRKYLLRCKEDFMD